MSRARTTTHARFAVAALVAVVVALTSLGAAAPARAAGARPTGLTVTSRATTSVRLAWKAVGKAPKYRVAYDDNSRFRSPAYAKPTTAGVEISGLKPGRTYWFKVKVISASSKSLSSYSKTIKVTTRSKASSLSLLSPTGVRVTSAGDTALALAWSGRGSTDRYRVRWAPDDKPSQLSYVRVSGTRVTLTGLKAGTTYRINVRVIKSSGKSLSPYSTTLKATTAKRAAYTTPTGLTATPTGSTGVSLTWNASPGALQYRVKYATTPWTDPGYTTSESNTASITGLSPQTTYYLKVRVLDTSGKAVTDYSATTTVTTSAATAPAPTPTPTPPVSLDPPSGVRATASSPTGVRVTWAAADGAPKYRVKYATTPWTSPKYLTTDTNAATITGLTPQTTYYLKVRILDTDGTALTGYSTTITVATPATVTYAAPTGLRVDATSPTQATLTWTAVPGAPAYRVKYASTPWTDAAYATTTGNTATITGLDALTTFSFKVRVLDADGSVAGDYSSTVSATMPSEPRPLRVASYNVRCWNCGPDSANEQPWTVRRSAVVTTIHGVDPDVVALQEAQQSRIVVDGKSLNLAQFEDLTNRLGSPWTLANANRYNCVKASSSTNCTYQDRGASNGTKIIYRSDRLKLVRQGSVALPLTKEHTYPRWLAWAVLRQKSTGKEFFFGDIHFEPNNDAGTSLTYYNVRLKEAQTVVSAIARLNPGKLPVVLAGDPGSNKWDSPSNGPYNTFVASGLVDPLGNTDRSSVPQNATVEKRIHTNYNSFNAWESYARRSGNVNGTYTDYILTSPMRISEWETVVKVDANNHFIGTIPSDHNLVRATVWLP